MPLSVSRSLASSVARRTMQKFEKCGLSSALLAQWVEDLEFELAREPGTKLQRVFQPDDHYEITMPQTVGTRQFRVHWELEVNWNSQSVHVLEISPIELRPRLDKSP